MVLLDIKKAYNTECLSGIFYKLISMHLPNYSLFFPKSYLKGLAFTVHINDTNSSPKPTPPVFFRVPYYRHYFPFTFPTCRALCTPPSHYTQMTLSFCLSPGGLLQSAALTTLLKYFTTRKLSVRTHKTETILFSKSHLPPPGLADPLQIHDNFVPCTSAVSYLLLVLDSNFLYTQCLHTVANKVMGVPVTFPPLLARDSRLTKSKKLTLYRFLILSILTYATTVCSSTCPSNYLRLPVVQSRYLQGIGNYPRPTPTSHLHGTLNIAPIPVMIHRLTAKFFAHGPFQPNPLVQQIGNYTLADRAAAYKKYKHKSNRSVIFLDFFTAAYLYSFLFHFFIV